MASGVLMALILYDFEETGAMGIFMHPLISMKLLVCVRIKHIIRKHKEQATAWYQNYLYRVKDNTVMKS